jgi:hypothetical protein
VLLSAVEKLIQESRPRESKRTDNPFDKSSIHAAVTLALESAMPILIEELTERVVLALSNRR